MVKLLQRPAVGYEEAEAGYFGKLRAHGDFLAGRVPRPLRDRLDDWLQRAIATSRRHLGEDWQRAFDAMPLWCFVFGPGLGDGAPVVGVMGPSRDRVGRSFPLIVLSRLDHYRGRARALCDEDEWFAAAVTVLCDAREDGFGPARLEEDTRHLPLIGSEAMLSGSSDPDTGRSLWWTHRLGTGAARFAAAGLPAPSEFHRMLGQFPEPTAPSPKTASTIPSPVPPPRKPDPKPVSPPKLSVTSASHAGTRWRVNADALGHVDHGEGRLLVAIADGAANDAASAEAARLVVSRLERTERAVSLEETVQHVKGELGRANALLRTRDMSESAPTAGVAVLALAEGRFAAIWAGDVRLYLLRDGTMRVLTRDHVEIGMQRRLARSVGGAAQFNPETLCDLAKPGDRFLLCSRALPHALGERAVAEILLEPQSDARRLVEDALIAGSQDNISAIVADYGLA